MKKVTIEEITKRLVETNFTPFAIKTSMLGDEYANFIVVGVMKNRAIVKNDFFDEHNVFPIIVNKKTYWLDDYKEKK